MKNELVEKYEDEFDEEVEQAKAAGIAGNDEAREMHLARADKIAQTIVSIKKELGFNWKQPLAAFVSSFLLLVAGKMIDRHTLFKQTERVCKFESDGTFTTQAGKGVGRSLGFWKW